MRGLTRLSPLQASRQTRQLQFHCGTPPPAAEPSTSALSRGLAGDIIEARRDVSRAARGRGEPTSLHQGARRRVEIVVARGTRDRERGHRARWADGETRHPRRPSRRVRGRRRIEHAAADGGAHLADIGRLRRGASGGARRRARRRSPTRGLERAQQRTEIASQPLVGAWGPASARVSAGVSALRRAGAEEAWRAGPRPPSEAGAEAAQARPEPEAAEVRAAAGAARRPGAAEVRVVAGAARRPGAAEVPAAEGRLFNNLWLRRRRLDRSRGDVLRRRGRRLSRGFFGRLRLFGGGAGVSVGGASGSMSTITSLGGSGGFGARVTIASAAAWSATTTAMTAGRSQGGLRGGGSKARPPSVTSVIARARAAAEPRRSGVRWRRWRCGSRRWPRARPSPRQRRRTRLPCRRATARPRWNCRAWP